MNPECPLCGRPVVLPTERIARATGGVKHAACATRGMRRNDRGGWTR